MSSKKFEDLQDDFKTLMQDLTRKIENVSKAYGEDKRSQIRDIQRILDEVQTLFTELEKEASNAPPPYRQAMSIQTKQYRQDLMRVSKKVTQLGGGVLSSTSTRQQLFATGSPMGGPSGSVPNNRGRLLQMNETLDRTTDTIARTHQLAAETDQIGTEVIEELGTQREALIRTKERLMDTDDNLRASRRILRSMYRRVITNKLILIVIIVLEIAILVGVVWYKYFT